MRTGIYTRVSTEGQSVDMQLSDLRQYTRQRGFTAYKEYSDIGISGSKGNRPMLDALMDDARKGKIDAVLVWRFDRFARSTRHLINALHEFNHLGIEFISYTENVDTSSPTGKVLFTIISAIAEFERDLIRERVKAGINHARQKGIRLGRPPVINEDLIERMRDLKAGGLSIRRIAKEVAISPSLVHKTLSGLGYKDIAKTGIQGDVLGCLEIR